MKSKSIQIMARNIAQYLAQATPSEREAGILWYADARLWATGVAGAYDLTVEQVCDITALLSPQQSWERNKVNVTLFLEGDMRTIFASGKALMECTLVVSGDFSLARVANRRPKTAAFSSNIAHVKSEAVTIDRHAIKVAYNQSSSTPIAITAKRYRETVEAYRRVDSL